MKFLYLIGMFYYIYFKTLEVSCGCGDYRPKEYENLTIDMKLYVDEKTMPANYTQQMIRDHLHKVVLIADKFLHEVAWTYPLRLELIDLKFMESGLGYSVKEVSAQMYLEEFCTWQISRKNYSEFYYSIMITGLNLLGNVNDDSSISLAKGIAYSGRLCFLSLSCAVVRYEDDIIRMASNLAHELGHSLNATHDEKDSSCDKGIMAKDDDDTGPIITSWSNCTKDAVEAFLKSDFANCLGSEDYRKFIRDLYNHTVNWHTETF